MRALSQKRGGNTIACQQYLSNDSVAKTSDVAIAAPCTSLEESIEDVAT